MSEIYNVIFTGKIKSSADQKRLVALFSVKFKLGHEKAEKLISSGRAITLKKDIDLDKALKLQEVLKNLGMIVKIDPDPESEEPSYPTELVLGGVDNEDDDATEVLDRSDMPRAPQCPKCGSYNMQLGICQDCGIVASKYIDAQARHSEDKTWGTQPSQEDPYATPEAELEEHDDEEMVGPHGVSIGRGFSWVVSGWQLFKGAPMEWLIAVVLLFVMNFLVVMVPLVGPIVVILLGPTLFAGFMLGCREQEEDGVFTIGHLFAGFRQNTGQTFLVGFFYLLFSMLILAAMALFMYSSLGDFISKGGDMEMALSMVFSAPVLISAVGGVIAFFMLLMAYIFAPALVVLEDLSAWEAMKLSFVGCLKNLLPLTLYSILVIVLFLLNSVFLLLSPILMVVAMILFVLGFVVLFPIQIGALYTAYREIYYD
jgi:ribosomal protein L32